MYYYIIFKNKTHIYIYIRIYIYIDSYILYIIMFCMLYIYIFWYTQSPTITNHPPRLAFLTYWQLLGVMAWSERPRFARVAHWEKP